MDAVFRIVIAVAGEVCTAWPQVHSRLAILVAVRIAAAIAIGADYRAAFIAAVMIMIA